MSWFLNEPYSALPTAQPRGSCRQQPVGGGRGTPGSPGGTGTCHEHHARVLGTAGRSDSAALRHRCPQPDPGRSSSPSARECTRCHALERSVSPSVGVTGHGAVTSWCAQLWFTGNDGSAGTLPAEASGDSPEKQAESVPQTAAQSWRGGKRLPKRSPSRQTRGDKRGL